MLEEFARSAETARRKKLWDIEDSVQRDDERQRQEKREREEGEAIEATLVATSAELAAFRDRLDRYDTATVAALMDNEAARAESRALLEGMLSQAYILPDGRRAFRSEDGLRVFDENGAAVSPDVVHPDMIHGGPSWEAYAAERVRQNQLEQERTQLLQYQARVDQARRAIANQPSTRDELEGLDAGLKEAMPDAVRRRLAGNTPDPDSHTVPQQASDKPAAIQSGFQPGNPSL